jgi:DNA-binding transcriptional ArsR family regulator
MKASPKGRVRPTILFSQTPHSVSRRAKRLSNRTAAELLRHLCELTIGFGRGSIDLTYRALAEALHKDWRTIARAASLLRALGDVEVESLENRSYRWFVLLEPEDIVADPEGLYRVRSARSVDQTQDPHGENAMGSWQKRHGGHGENAMGVMAKTPWEAEHGGQLLKPPFTRDEAPPEKTENGVLKIDLKDTSLKIHHQTESQGELRDDVSLVNHKKLLEELIAVGTGQRMARRLLRNHDHDLIASALQRVRHRTDLENRAGYLIREVEDGGYQKTLELVKRSEKVSRETSEAPATGSIVANDGVQRTKMEQAALEAERASKALAYQQSLQVLLQRFKGLSTDLQLELKARWTKHLEKMVPNTPRKAAMMEDEVFKKISFKEVTTRFFELVDQGLCSDSALAQLAA